MRRLRRPRRAAARHVAELSRQPALHITQADANARALLTPRGSRGETSAHQAAASPWRRTAPATLIVEVREMQDEFNRDPYGSDVPEPAAPAPPPPAFTPPPAPAAAPAKPKRKAARKPAAKKKAAKKAGTGQEGEEGQDRQESQEGGQGQGAQGQRTPPGEEEGGRAQGWQEEQQQEEEVAPPEAAQAGVQGGCTEGCSPFLFSSRRPRGGWPSSGRRLPAPCGPAPGAGAPAAPPP